MRLFFIFLFLCISYITFAQTKVVKGDTMSYFEYHKKDIIDYKLKDFSKSKDDFNFRIWRRNQVVQISKKDSLVSGEVVNYIYQSIRNKRKLFITTDTLSVDVANKAYNYILKSKILDLPTDKDIKNWSHGFDGITYIIEHADKETHFIKQYWTPQAQGSLPEAISLLNFNKEFVKLTDADNSDDNFKKALPKRGCYITGMVSVCYSTPTPTLGYYSSSNLLYGYSLSHGITYIKKTKLNIYYGTYASFNGKSERDVSYYFGKSGVFLKSEKDLNDYMVLKYRNRRLLAIENQLPHNNYIITYGLSGFKKLKNVSFQIGLDRLVKGNQKEQGVLLESYKLFKWQIRTSVQASFFKNKTNYIFTINKGFSFAYKHYPKWKYLHSRLGLHYESFEGFKSLGGSYTIHF